MSIFLTTILYTIVLIILQLSTLSTGLAGNHSGTKIINRHYITENVSLPLILSIDSSSSSSSNSSSSSIVIGSTSFQSFPSNSMLFYGRVCRTATTAATTVATPTIIISLYLHTVTTKRHSTAIIIDKVRI